MNTESQKIPIPRSQRWKEFRLKGLPVLMFVVTTLVVLQLWSERTLQANMTGVVVGSVAEIRSPAAGYLAEFEVDRFQQVSAGQVIGRVITTDPRLLEARLAVALAEVELLRLGGGEIAEQQRGAVARESLEMDLMTQRIELASAELRLQQAERDIERVEELLARGLIPSEEYERARSERDVLALEVQQKNQMIGELRTRLQSMSGQNGAADGPASAAIRRQADELRLIEVEARPVDLVAPIAGMVTQIFRSNGERVNAEEPVLVLRSSQPEYIVAYLPQPLRVQPEVGMPVAIRSRSPATAEFSGQVVEVGAQIETMMEVDSLRPIPTGGAGLPIKVAFLEEGLPLRPGELVQLTLRTED